MVEMAETGLHGVISGLEALARCVKGIIIILHGRS